MPLPQPIPYVAPKPTPQPGPSALPTFAAVTPKPRGNPGAWVTVNDYRSSWINREMTGTARFKLDIGATGRVDHVGWRVAVEVLELERIPSTTDVMATYEVRLDDEGELQGYRRVHRYLRGSPGDE